MQGKFIFLIPCSMQPWSAKTRLQHRLPPQDPGWPLCSLVQQLCEGTGHHDLHSSSSSKVHVVVRTSLRDLVGRRGVLATLVNHKTHVYRALHSPLLLSYQVENCDCVKERHLREHRDNQSDCSSSAHTRQCKGSQKKPWSTGFASRCQRSAAVTRQTVLEA